MTDHAGGLAESLVQALANRDLGALGALLADDVRWGDDDHPRCCRCRSDVVATFGRLLAEGVEATITEVLTGSRGVVCGFRVRWPEEVRRPAERHLYHLYLVSDGRIAEIRAFDDRASAAQAAGA